MAITNRISLKAAGLTLVLAGLSGILVSTDAALAVFVGGLIALANFRLSSRSLQKIVSPSADQGLAKGMAVFSTMMRYGITAAIILFVIKSGILPVYFIIGLSAVVGAVFFSYKDIKNIQREAV